MQFRITIIIARPSRNPTHAAYPSQHGNRPAALQISHRSLHLLRTILGAGFPQWRAVTGTCAPPGPLAKYARDHAAEVTLEPGWGLGGGQAEEGKNGGRGKST
jgi:hypothetical protein